MKIDCLLKKERKIKQQEKKKEHKENKKIQNKCASSFIIHMKKNKNQKILNQAKQVK